ncbi:hypothetical protein WAI17_18165 [Acinetobacter baumannii]|uniref:hypothetical protein n=1 Tax=Acinetobacter baumannii TaxID=470 RepID=UPI000913EB8E|nr:hypothetical protein [Acinetobacter baumannii]MDC4766660.1 hypothetical protein [Acinetobacter baumannii]MDH2579851.1 hypothetical protein [Acinetobacter baumannii]MDV7462699.1 hypothetical protein [Acinetobacter baumannii]OIF58441.1 hypothetical protein A7N09_16260 [Acinetobacter baumannii]HCA5039417.1 hypothetical protein [Acinetobacter baumannii]
MGIGLEIYDEKGNLQSTIGNKRLLRIIAEFDISGDGSYIVDTTGLGDVTIFFMTRNSQSIPDWTPQNIYLDGNVLIWHAAVPTNIVVGVF